MEKTRHERGSLRRKVLLHTVKNSTCVSSNNNSSTTMAMDVHKRYMEAILSLLSAGQWTPEDTTKIKQWRLWILIQSVQQNEKWRFSIDKDLDTFAVVLRLMFFDERYPYLHRAREQLNKDQAAQLMKLKDTFEDEHNARIAMMANNNYIYGSRHTLDESIDEYTFDEETDHFKPNECSTRSLRDKSKSPERIFKRSSVSKYRTADPPKKTYSVTSTVPRKRDIRSTSASSADSSCQPTCDIERRKKHRSGDSISRVHHNIGQYESTSSVKGGQSPHSQKQKTLSDKYDGSIAEPKCSSEENVDETSCTSNEKHLPFIFENPTPPWSPANTTSLVDSEVARRTNHSTTCTSTVNSRGWNGTACTSSLDQKPKSPRSISSLSRKTNKFKISLRSAPSTKEPLTQSVSGSSANKPLKDDCDVSETEPGSHIEQHDTHIEQDKENYPITVDEIDVMFPKPPTAPPLTLEMFEALKVTLEKPPKEKVVSGFKLNVLQEDLAVYSKDTEWLNDRNIDFYLELIRDRSTKSGYPRVYTFGSFFYPMLTAFGYDYLKEATGEDDVFKYDIVFFPINLNHHWRLVVVKFQEKSLKCYDSLKHDNIDILKNIGRYLVMEYRRKHRTNNNAENGIKFSDSSSEDEPKSPIPDLSTSSIGAQTSSFFDRKEWTVENVPSESIPQQNNAIDCGIFLLQYAEYLSVNKEFDFDQSHIPYFRKRIMYETLTKQLLAPVKTESHKEIKKEQV